MAIVRMMIKKTDKPSEEQLKTIRKIAGKQSFLIKTLRK